MRIDRERLNSKVSVWFCKRCTNTQKQAGSRKSFSDYLNIS